MNVIRKYPFELVCAFLFVSLLVLADHITIGPDGESALHIIVRDFVLGATAVWEWVVKPALALTEVVTGQIAKYG